MACSHLLRTGITPILFSIMVAYFTSIVFANAAVKLEKKSVPIHSNVHQRKMLNYFLLTKRKSIRKWKCSTELNCKLWRKKLRANPPRKGEIIIFFVRKMYKDLYSVVLLTRFVWNVNSKSFGKDQITAFRRSSSSIYIIPSAPFRFRYSFPCKTMYPDTWKCFHFNSSRE
jgi:hypothetical protein